MIRKEVIQDPIQGRGTEGDGGNYNTRGKREKTARDLINL